MLHLEVPVKPYIKSYLENRYGSPAKLAGNDIIGNYFIKLLEDYSREQDKSIDISYYSQKIIIAVNQDIVLRNGSYITKTNVRDFNRKVERIIKERIHDFLNAALKYSPNIQFKKAIDDFREENGLPEHCFSYEAIKKDFYRYRKESNGLIRMRKSINK